MPSIVCQRCHEVNEPNAVTCQKCGARFCPSCHLIIESPDASVCPHCGKRDVSFRPGKYSAAAPSSAGSSHTYCSNCGSKIEPGARKCPYCGRLGQLVTQTPPQGYGVMQPADSGAPAAYNRTEPQTSSKQKVCAKCGTPIPPGSSLCPIHGKFGGGAVLRDDAERTPGRYTGDIWRRIEAKRAASAEAEQMRAEARRTLPREIYPQMAPAPIPQEATTYPGAHQADVAEQRICPNCHSPVPDRSKICPSCGWNRLPVQKSRPMLRAEDYYKSQVATTPASPPFTSPLQPNAAPPVDQYYAQPNFQQQDQYYGQPAVQPYDIAIPAPAPRLKEKPRQEKRRSKQGRRDKAAYEEGLDEEEQPRKKKSPMPVLLALLALAGVIVISVVLLMDQLKTPPPATLSPAATNAGTIVAKPPEISNIQFSDITQTSAVVTWQTDKKSSSIVIYCLEGGTQCQNAKDNTMVTDHKVSLSDLEPNKSYHITVKSLLGDDPDAPEATKEAVSVLITSGARDTTPPVISMVKDVNKTSSSVDSSVTIEWLTDEPATSQVAYGTSSTYGSVQPSNTDTTLLKDHSVTLNGLPLQATIHYKVISRDAAGNEASSPDATVMTPQASGTKVGQMAPDFTLQCADGTEITLSNLRGNKVIINFWSLSCPYCDSEMPALQQIHVDNPNVHLLAICGPQVSPVNKPVVGSKIQLYTFTVPIDESGTVGQLYNVNGGVPVTYFLDSNGVIKAFKDGAFTNGSSEIDAMLKSYN